MAYLAIQGHATRGNEVIALLKMLGGIDSGFFSGNETDRFYYIEVDKGICFIDSVVEHLDFCKLTIEQFLERFPYKVGDRVIAYVEGILAHFTIQDVRWNDKLNKIEYKICSSWCDTSLMQPYKEETMEDKPNLLQQLKEYFDNTPREVIEKEWHQYDKYNEIGPKVNEYLEYVNNIRQPKYPKTYEECSGVINKIARNLNECEDSETYMPELMYAYQKLRICRDAYWNIAGDWEPDWNNISDKHCIYVVGGEIWLKECQTRQCNLAFPTAEMRDAFYENFKELIESCKELL